jgi:hypothetical protein
MLTRSVMGLLSRYAIFPVIDSPNFFVTIIYHYQNKLCPSSQCCY